MSYSRKETKTVDNIIDLWFAISEGIMVVVPLFIMVLIVRAFEIGKEFLHGKKCKRRYIF